jgi:uncharacterized membrane protein YhiD involved in acid resistance
MGSDALKLISGLDAVMGVVIILIIRNFFQRINKFEKDLSKRTTKEEMHELLDSRFDVIEYKLSELSKQFESVTRVAIK